MEIINIFRKMQSRVSSSLRNRMLIIIIVVFSAYIFFEHIIQWQIVYPRFVQLETSELVEDIERVRAAIDQEIYHLKVNAVDWGSWDDTYRFIQDGNREFIDTYLTKETFSDLGVNLIYMNNISGHCVWSKAYDPITGESIELPEFPGQIPWNQFGNISSSTSAFSHSGIRMTEKGPMLVASKPILPGSKQGPVKGMLIMGVFLTKDKINAIGDLTQVLLDISPFDSRAKRTEKNKLFNAGKTSPEQPGYDYKLNKDTITGYAILNDIYNKPALLMEINVARVISRQGKRAMQLGMAFLIVISVCVALVCYFFLKVVIADPLTNLADHMTLLDRNGLLNPIEEYTTRRDEIGTVTREFNFLIKQVDFKIKEQKKLIDSLEKASKEIKSLQGIIPICSSCKKIRDDEGYWHKIEQYISTHSMADFSHGICPDCVKELYPDLDVQDAQYNDDKKPDSPDEYI